MIRRAGDEVKGYGDDRSIEGLNLHTFETTKPKEVDKKIAEVKKRVFPPHLYVPHQKVTTQVATPSNEQRTMSDLANLLAPTVESLGSDRDYNGLHPLVKLLHSFEKSPGKKEAQVAYEFALTFDEEAVETKGSTCVGRSRELVDLLKAEFGVDARMVYQKEGQFLPHNHSAVIVRAKDGVLLIDLLYKPGQRIIPISSGSRVDSPVGTIECDSLDRYGKSAFLKVSKEDKDFGSYELQIENGDQIVMAKYLFRRHLYPIVCYKDGKPFKVVKVTPSDGKVILQQGSGKSSSIVGEFSFDDIKTSPDTFKSALFEFMGDDFKTSKDLALEQVATICRNQDALERFYTQIRAPGRAQN